jgi:hypothetical protein
VTAGDSLFAFLGDKVVARFNLDLKRLQWSAEASKEWTSARPYLWRDPVLARDRHELIALRSADGSRAWSFQFPEIVRGIGASPDVLYVGTLKGRMFAYSPKTAVGLKMDARTYWKKIYSTKAPKRGFGIRTAST